MVALPWKVPSFKEPLLAALTVAAVAAVAMDGQMPVGCAGRLTADRLSDWSENDTQESNPQE